MRFCVLSAIIGAWIVLAFEVTPRLWLFIGWAFFIVVGWIVYEVSRALTIVYYQAYVKKRKYR